MYQFTNEYATPLIRVLKLESEQVFLSQSDPQIPGLDNEQYEGSGSFDDWA